MLQKIFRLKEHGTNVRTELTAGFTTFITMSYILAVNPAMLSITGIPAGSVFTATVLGSVIATLIMGIAANMPVALSAGMGLNAFFAYTVCLKMGYPYQLALTAVFCEGLLFILLSLFNVREAIVYAIPAPLKAAVAAGIGCFIAFIGLQNGGIVTANRTTLVTIGDLRTPDALLTLTGLILCIILYLRRIKGAFLISMLTVMVLGIPAGITRIPDGFSPFSLPDKPLFFDFTPDRIFTLDFLIVFFTFLFMDIFDTVGTLIAIATQGGLVKEDGTIPKIRQAFLSDAIGTTAGAVLGTSTISCYVESASGVAEGGRTGLTAVTVAALFLLSLFCSPLFLLIPSVATAPVLIMVGFLMAGALKKIDFTNCAEGLPAFLAVIMMPLAYSIAEGIVFGILSYVLCTVADKRAKEIPAVTWTLAIIFLIWLFIRSA